MKISNLTNQKIEEIKVAIEDGDNERIHGLYDDVIEGRLKDLDPKFLTKVKRLVKDIDFWYA